MTAVLLLAISMGIAVSVVALLLEEITFHVYPGIKYLFVLFVIAFIENFGYRQLTAYWRLIGIYRWVIRKEGGWGKMVRTASWSKN